MCYWEDKADVAIENSIKMKLGGFNETIQSKRKKRKKKIIDI